MYSPLCEKSLAFSHGLTGVWICASERIQETVQEAIYCYVQGLCTKVREEGKGIGVRRLMDSETIKELTCQLQD